MNKQRLDRFLTTPPDVYSNDFYNYVEAILEEFTEEFYYLKEELLLNSEIIDNWYIKLESKGTEPAEASAIIERAVKVYKL